MIDDFQAKITDIIIKKEVGLIVKSIFDAEFKKINELITRLNNFSVLISAYNIDLSSSVYNGLFNPVIVSEINDYIKNNLSKEFDDTVDQILKSKVPITDNQKQKN